MSTLGTIKDIFIYPIKSLAGIALENCFVTKHGISHPLNKQVIDRFILFIAPTKRFEN